MIEFRARGRRLEPPEAVLPGRYKGKRKRAGSAGVPVNVPCEVPGCEWKSGWCKPAKAEWLYQRHIGQAHGSAH